MTRILCVLALVGTIGCSSESQSLVGPSATALPVTTQATYPRIEAFEDVTIGLTGVVATGEVGGFTEPAVIVPAPVPGKGHKHGKKK